MSGDRHLSDKQKEYILGLHEKLYQNRRLTADVKLFPVNASDENDILYAHKYILAAGCQYFRDLFYPELNPGPEVAENAAIIPISQCPRVSSQTPSKYGLPIDKAVLEIVLEGIYFDQYSISLDKWKGLMDASKLLKLDSLTKVCYNFLMDQNVTKETWLIHFRLVKNDENGEEILRSVYEFLKTISTEVSDMEEFLELEFHELKVLVNAGVFANSVDLELAKYEWFAHDKVSRRLCRLDLVHLDLPKVDSNSNLQEKSNENLPQDLPNDNPVQPTNPATDGQGPSQLQHLSQPSTSSASQLPDPVSKRKTLHKPTTYGGIGKDDFPTFISSSGVSGEEMDTSIGSATPEEFIEQSDHVMATINSVLLEMDGGGKEARNEQNGDQINSNTTTTPSKDPSSSSKASLVVRAPPQQPKKLPKSSRAAKTLPSQPVRTPIAPVPSRRSKRQLQTKTLTSEDAPKTAKDAGGPPPLNPQPPLEFQAPVPRPGRPPKRKLQEQSQTPKAPKIENFKGVEPPVDKKSRMGAPTMQSPSQKSKGSKGSKEPSSEKKSHTRTSSNSSSSTSSTTSSNKEKDTGSRDKEDKKRKREDDDKKKVVRGPSQVTQAWKIPKIDPDKPLPRPPNPPAFNLSMNDLFGDNDNAQQVHLHDSKSNDGVLGGGGDVDLRNEPPVVMSSSNQILGNFGNANNTTTSGIPMSSGGGGPIMSSPWAQNNQQGEPMGPNPFEEALQRPPMPMGSLGGMMMGGQRGPMLNPNMFMEPGRPGMGIDMNNPMSHIPIPMIIDEETLRMAKRDLPVVIPLDKTEEEVLRFYGETAIVMMGGLRPNDEEWPRTIYYQPNRKPNVLKINNKIRLDLLVGGPKKQFTLLGGWANKQSTTHSVRIIAPTRELCIDDKYFKADFGGSPIEILLNGKMHLFELEGPPPQVKIGNTDRFDLVAGRVILYVESCGAGSRQMKIYLDYKPQLIDLFGSTVILQFVDNFRTVTLNWKPFPVFFGGPPLLIATAPDSRFNLNPNQVSNEPLRKLSLSFAPLLKHQEHAMYEFIKAREGHPPPTISIPPPQPPPQQDKPWMVTSLEATWHQDDPPSPLTTSQHQLGSTEELDGKKVLKVDKVVPTLSASAHQGDLKQCPQCDEQFEEYYDEEAKEWRIRNAIYREYSHEEEEGDETMEVEKKTIWMITSLRIFHPECYDERFD